MTAIAKVRPSFAGEGQKRMGLGVQWLTSHHHSPSKTKTQKGSIFMPADEFMQEQS
jgi:hypothetical protein